MHDATRFGLALAFSACASHPQHHDATSSSDGTAPGASVRCESSGKNAFETYGAPAFFAVTKAVFANVAREIAAHGDANVGDSFGKVGDGTLPATQHDAAAFEGHVAAFLVFAYGGPSTITYTDGKTYDGPQRMDVAHTGLHITSEQFDYFISKIIVPALIATGVKHGAGGAADPNDLASCFAPVVTDAAFKASIVGY